MENLLELVLELILLKRLVGEGLDPNLIASILLRIHAFVYLNLGLN